jgi:hypothetical protein
MFVIIERVDTFHVNLVRKPVNYKNEDFLYPFID